MDRTLSPTLPTIALELMYASNHFETAVPKDSRKRAQEALALLGELEKFASESFAPEISPDVLVQTPIAQTTPRVEPQTPPQTPAQAPAPQYGSHNQEYRPALQNPSVVEALLRLRGAPTAARATTFSSERLPEIQADPKPDAPFRAGSGQRRPVLRTRDE